MAESAQELVYRMRTCAAAIIASQAAGNPWDTTRIAADAADLLAEASNLLDAPEPLGEPMPVLTSAPTQTNVQAASQSVSAQPCPSCGSVDARTAQRVGRGLMLTCPKCAAQFPFKPAARWQ
jgi:predicted RNA-binding Zn-ribbon protein involved in translation (DUF1610 family)